MKENLFEENESRKNMISENNFRSELFSRTVEVFKLFLPILRSARLDISEVDIIPDTLIKFALESNYEMKVEFSESLTVPKSFNVMLTNPAYRFEEITSSCSSAGTYSSSDFDLTLIRYFYKLVCRSFSETLVAFHRAANPHEPSPSSGTLYGKSVRSSISSKVKNLWCLDSAVTEPELVETSDYSRFVSGIVLTPDNLYPMCVIDLWISADHDKLHDTSGKRYDGDDDIDDYLINKILIKS